jgi:hypothetical protein
LKPAPTSFVELATLAGRFRREIEFDPGDEIQPRRRIAERLLVMLVEEIIQSGAGLYAEGNPTSESCVCFDGAFLV